VTDALPGSATSPVTREGHTTGLTPESSTAVSDGLEEGSVDGLADGFIEGETEALGEALAEGIEEGSAEADGEGSPAAVGVGDEELEGSFDDGLAEGVDDGEERAPDRICRLSVADGAVDSEALWLGADELDGSELVGSTEGSVLRDGDTGGVGLSSPGAGDGTSPSGMLVDGDGFGDWRAAGRTATHGTNESAAPTFDETSAADSTAKDAELPESTKAVLATAARTTRNCERT